MGYHFKDVEDDLIRLESLEDEMADKDESFDCLEMEHNNLKDKYDDLYDENRTLENTKDTILNEINNLAIELSEGNIEEIKSKLQDLYYKY